MYVKRTCIYMHLPLKKRHRNTQAYKRALFIFIFLSNSFSTTKSIAQKLLLAGTLELTILKKLVCVNYFENWSKYGDVDQEW